MAEENKHLTWAEIEQRLEELKNDKCLGLFFTMLFASCLLVVGAVYLAYFIAMRCPL